MSGIKSWFKDTRDQFTNEDVRIKINVQRFSFPLLFLSSGSRVRPYPVVFLLLSDWLAVCTRPRYAQPSPPHRFHARKYGESVHSYSSCTSSCCLLFTYLFLSVVRFDKASFEVSHCPRFKSPDFYLWTPGGGLSPVLSRTDRSLFASATTKGIFIRAIRHFTSGTASV